MIPIRKRVGRVSSVKQRILEMTNLRIILLLSLLTLSLAAIGKDEKTFGWMGDLIFGNCDTSTCRYDQGRARQCCDSGRNTRSDMSG